MNSVLAGTAFTIASALPIAMAQAETAPNPPWSYTTPSTDSTHWAELSPHYQTCATGRMQSPIDIRTALKADLPALTFDYRPGAATVLNNGHTIQITPTDAGSARLADSKYRLEQFHFHSPSEELIEGRAYPLSVHLVHRNDANKLAVIAILIEEGADNPALTAILAAMTETAGTSPTPISTDPGELLPTQRSYYSYLGSLTTPPCSEEVRWYIMAQPVSASKIQLERFKALYPMNARPVQPLNGRNVYIGG